MADESRRCLNACHLRQRKTFHMGDFRHRCDKADAADSSSPGLLGCCLPLLQKVGE